MDVTISKALALAPVSVRDLAWQAGVLVFGFCSVLDTCGFGYDGCSEGHGVRFV